MISRITGKPIPEKDSERIDELNRELAQLENCYLDGLTWIRYKDLSEELSEICIKHGWTTRIEE